MKILSPYLKKALVISVFISAATNASVIQFSVTSTVSDVQGSFIGDFSAGDIINGVFAVDDDTANGGPGSDPGPGTNPGHEYTAFWEFNGPSYGVSLLDDQHATSFTSEIEAIVVNDGLTLASEDTGGIMPGGTYDWIEVLGSTTSDYCPPATDCLANPNEILVADGQEWTLAIFASDDSWFTGGDIPQGLPASYTAFLIGFKYDDVGDETGMVLSPLDTLTIMAVPIPAAIWLFGSALAGVGWVRRKSFLKSIR